MRKNDQPNTLIPFKNESFFSEIKKNIIQLKAKTAASLF